MKRVELTNLDVVSTSAGTYLYVSNLFYPLYPQPHTYERRGRKSVPLKDAVKLCTLRDSHEAFLMAVAE